MINDLKIIMLNINGAREKLHDLTELINNNNPHIILITESRLNDNVPDSLISIPGYNTVRLDRKHAKCGSGGLLLYIVQDLNFSILSENFITDSESINVKISFSRRKSLSIVLLYRPPSSNLHNFLHSFEQFLSYSDPNSPVVIAGDFNIDIFNTPLSISSHDYLHILSANSFRQTVWEPTRITPQHRSIIDHVSVNSAINNFSCKVFDNSCSDHQGISFCLHKSLEDNKQKHAYISFREFKNFDAKNFMNDVNSIDWSPLICNRDVNIMWEFFKTNMINTG